MRPVMGRQARPNLSGRFGGVLVHPPFWVWAVVPGLSVVSSLSRQNPWSLTAKIGQRQAAVTSCPLSFSQSSYGQQSGVVARGMRQLLSTYGTRSCLPPPPPTLEPHSTCSGHHLMRCNQRQLMGSHSFRPTYPVESNGPACLPSVLAVDGSMAL